MAVLNAAREAFEANEPRDLFYRAATQLIELAIAYGLWDASDNGLSGLDLAAGGEEGPGENKDHRGDRCGEKQFIVQQP